MEDTLISSNDRQTRRNEDIRVPQVRVIGADGEQVGILSRDEALQMAGDAGLDLVEIQPNAEPPVCRIMDFGKYRFDLQKKANAAKKKQKQKRKQRQKQKQKLKQKLKQQQRKPKKSG